MWYTFFAFEPEIWPRMTHAMLHILAENHDVQSVQEIRHSRETRPREGGERESILKDLEGRGEAVRNKKRLFRGQTQTPLKTKDDLRTNPIQSH